MWPRSLASQTCGRPHRVKHQPQPQRCGPCPHCETEHQPLLARIQSERRSTSYHLCQSTAGAPRTDPHAEHSRASFTGRPRLRAVRPVPSHPCVSPDRRNPSEPLATAIPVFPTGSCKPTHLSRTFSPTASPNFPRNDAQRGPPAPSCLPEPPEVSTNETAHRCRNTRNGRNGRHQSRPGRRAAGCTRHQD